MLKIILTALAMPLIVAVPLFLVYLRVKKGHGAKRPLIANMVLFFSVITVCAGVFLEQGASAVSAAVDGGSIATAAGYISAALAVSVSGLASAKAVSTSASAAIGALVEDESTFGKSLVFVGLAEGIALYGLLVAFIIISRLG